MKNYFDPNKGTRSELCELVANFMAAHLEESNRHARRLAEALQEHEKTFKELEELRQRAEVSKVYAPVSIPPRDVAIAAAELHCQMKRNGVDGLFFGGLLASIPGGIK